MELEEIKRVRLDKMKAIQGQFQMDPFGSKFVITQDIGATLAGFEEGKEVNLAGRLMAVRSHGKVIFADLQDQASKIQIFIKAENVGEDAFNFCHQLDIGDIIGIHGVLFITKMGQQSVRVDSIKILSKSLLPLPEKWHGLKDIEVRYRQRYVDLIANEEVRQTFIKRSKIISAIRKFLDGRGFLEVETPMLQPMAGGARGRPFKSHHNAYNLEVFMRIAPELYLKRLLVGGLERVYELNRNFRNEGVSTRHNPEFTMLEVYEAYADYEDMMKLTEDIVSGLAKDVTGSLKVNYQGKVIDFTTPWERRSFAGMVKNKFNIDPHDDAATMLEKVKKIKGGRIKIDKLTRSAVMKIVEDVLEEDEIINPVFFTDYFTFLCPLAKTLPSNPFLSARFECFVAGMEIGNAYSELNDPIEQRKRLSEDLEDDVETGNRVIDEDFINALEHGMPPAGGLGIGIDRLVMLLTDSASIRDVILFPLMKPLEDLSEKQA